MTGWQFFKPGTELEFICHVKYLTKELGQNSVVFDFSSVKLKLMKP